MIYRHVEDWDDAYANGPNIPGGDRWPGLWVEQAKAFRDKLSPKGRTKLDLSYGDRPRNRFDLFLPEGEPKGLVVFVHGGYWVRLDKSFWSHLAEGSLAHGHAVAMPSYTLCPDIRISSIVTEVAAAIEAAARMIGGPIRLTGHSAGGHLVSRMITTSAPLSQNVQRRIVSTVSISGLHDLRPLMNIATNADLKIDREEAMAESPALLEPMAGARLACWVGAGERAEFIRQNALLANIWTGLCAWTSVIEEPDRHHFNVIDGLADPDHALTRTLLTG